LWQEFRESRPHLNSCPPLPVAEKIMLKIGETYKAREAIRLRGRLKLAYMMNLPEDEFARVIREINNDPLFQELKRLTIIRYKRFPGVSVFASKTVPLNPEISSGFSSPRGELFDNEDVLPIIERLGKENFKKYFLNNNERITSEEISEKCKLTIEETGKINDFVDKFYLENEFSQTPNNYRPKGISYTTVAKIEETDNGFVITSFSADLTRGKWTIHEETLKKLEDRFSPQEKRRIKGLLNKVRLINRRKSVIYQILENIIEIQRDYLASGDVGGLKPFTQKSLSRKIRIDPSLISRAIVRRTVETPKAGEIPLKRFFPRERDIRKRLIEKILEREKGSKSWSDEKIRRILYKKYYLSLSRRTVCDCRKELNIPSSYQRKAKGDCPIRVKLSKNSSNRSLKK